ncbi:MAG: nitroreductase family protein [Candidatus Asgardarchaeia archaeon]
MECLNLIYKRRSIRKYKSKEIPDTVLRLILEAARLSPSARNKQPWHFIIVKDDGLKEYLSQWRW